MKWYEGTPPETPFCNDLYFVRIEEQCMGGKRIKFDTHVWYGSNWYPLKHEYSGDKITHWAYIEDPVPFDADNIYDDNLGRLECVAQGQLHPDLSTPPAIETNL